MHEALLAEVLAAFAEDRARPPATSLRGGDALDDYREPPRFDAAVDAVTDGYLYRYHWGVGFLDAASWRHYLPALVEHALRGFELAGDVTIDAMLRSLRAPDGDPPRLASLSTAQEAAIVGVPDLLAFSERSKYAEEAQRALEEWWAPGALFRPS